MNTTAVVDDKLDQAHKLIDEAEAIMEGRAPAKSTELYAILDRSGSMATTQHDAEGGFNKLLEDQKKLQGDCWVTLVQFDTDYEVLCEKRALAVVEPWRCQPRGGTSLLDAIGRTLSRTRVQTTELTVVVVVTDGEENSSTKYTYAQVAALIDAWRARGTQFIFLGSNQDAIANAQKLHIPVQNAASYLNTNKAYGTVSPKVMSFRASGQSCALDFSESERTAMNEGSSGG